MRTGFPMSVNRLFRSSTSWSPSFHQHWGEDLCSDCTLYSVRCILFGLFMYLMEWLAISDRKQSHGEALFSLDSSRCDRWTRHRLMAIAWRRIVGWPSYIRGPCSHCGEQGFYERILRDKLRPVLRRRRRDLLREGSILLHDDASPHFETCVVQMLDSWKWEVLSHPTRTISRIQSMWLSMSISDFNPFGLHQITTLKMMFSNSGEKLSQRGEHQSTE